MLHPKERDRFLANSRAARDAARPSREIRAERELQARFKADLRSHGIHKAVDRMEAANDAKRHGEKRAAMYDQETQLKELFPPTVGARSCGRYSRWTDTTIDGVKGNLAQHYYDGALVLEQFTPTEEKDHEQGFKHVYQPDLESRFAAP